MKRTSTLKHILILGAFVLFSPMESNAYISDAKDRTACKNCKKEWIRRPYFTCLSPCLAEEKGSNPKEVCIEKCFRVAHSEENGSQLTKCILTKVSFSNQESCLFQE